MGYRNWSCVNFSGEFPLRLPVRGAENWQPSPTLQSVRRADPRAKSTSLRTTRGSAWVSDRTWGLAAGLQQSSICLPSPSLEQGSLNAQSRTQTAPQTASGEVEGDQVAQFLGRTRRGSGCWVDWPVLLPVRQHVPGLARASEHEWKDGDSWYSALAAAPSQRSSFASNCVGEVRAPLEATHTRRNRSTPESEESRPESLPAIMVGKTSPR
jgi:hypothetical protein